MSSVESLSRAVADVSVVRRAVLFGSSARGRADSRSDLDVAVELVGGPEAFSRLAVRLSRAAGRDVDLVSLREAPPLLRFEIARDAVRLDDVERAFAGPVETLLADVKARDLALFYLFLAIQE